jgi:MarR family transcriptional regulator, organic hydroperoxide resistance regulator
MFHMTTVETAATRPGDLPADPLALDQQVCFALVVAARSVVALYRPVLERLGLTHPQYLVMLALWQHAPLSVKRLGQLLQLDPGTLSPLLKRLEAAELITRRRDAADERLLSVELTTAGSDLRTLALDVPPAVMQRLGMSLLELQDLHTSLTRVIAAAVDTEEQS